MEGKTAAATKFENITKKKHLPPLSTENVTEHPTEEQAAELQDARDKANRAQTELGSAMTMLNAAHIDLQKADVDATASADVLFHDRLQRYDIANTNAKETYAAYNRLLVKIENQQRTAKLIAEIRDIVSDKTTPVRTRLATFIDKNQEIFNGALKHKKAEFNSITSRLDVSVHTDALKAMTVDELRDRKDVVEQLSSELDALENATTSDYNALQSADKAKRAEQEKQRAEQAALDLKKAATTILSELDKQKKLHSTQSAEWQRHDTLLDVLNEQLAELRSVVPLQPEPSKGDTAEQESTLNIQKDAAVAQCIAIFETMPATQSRIGQLETELDEISRQSEVARDEVAKLREEHEQAYAAWQDAQLAKADAEKAEVERKREVARAQREKAKTAKREADHVAFEESQQQSLRIMQIMMNRVPKPKTRVYHDPWKDRTPGIAFDNVDGGVPPDEKGLKARLAEGTDVENVILAELEEILLKK